VREDIVGVLICARIRRCCAPRKAPRGPARPSPEGAVRMRWNASSALAKGVVHLLELPGDPDDVVAQHLRCRACRSAPPCASSRP